ncbi:hypothetical protein ACFW35_13725 [Fictibacillus sp. NPDC058756]|uniref:hypothetical protein n=1 Tax=Fictibacillus sp. NPDC058756 TaxID=3346625 RepID=UPI00369E1701
MYNSFCRFDHSQAESILMALQREASAINLCQRLAHTAPNQHHRNHILYALEGKQNHLQQFTDLYSSLTGLQPEYRVDPVAFYSYKDGLRIAYEVEAEGCHEYQKQSQDQLDFQVEAYEDFAIMIPAGKWHNLTNTGDKPIKLYAIYAPPEHPFGTVHPTKAAAMAAEASE